MSRETVEFDVVIVGAGPAGLAAACRLGQLARAENRELSVCVVEKAAAIGAHIVSGAVFEVRALAELFSDYVARGAPLGAPVVAERLDWLRSADAGLAVPALLVPRLLRNHGNRILSLGDLCVWLAAQAEALGVSVLPGFAATDLLIDDGRVAGVVTGDFGVARDGSHKPGFQPGNELRARCVVLAEGCRGSLGRRLEQRFALRANADPPHFGLGFKEIWEIDPALHRPGEVVHTFGWPLDDATEGGGFLYHAAEPRVYVGFVVSLGYANPHLDPFAEFQRWKTHPRIRNSCCGYGIVNILDLQVGLESFVGPGHWNDPDMLEVGNGAMTNTEYRSHFSLWSILAAPLMAGNDPRNMTQEVREILTNQEVIAINQDSLGRQGRRIVKNGDLEVWAKQLKDGSQAVALFNRGASKQEISVEWRELGYPSHLSADVRDLWKHKDLGKSVGRVSSPVESHELVMLTVRP